MNCCPRRTVPAALALAFVCAAAATAPGALAEPASTVTVKTSRGEFGLLVFSPADPPGAPPAGAAAPSGPAPAARPPVLIISGEGGWRSFDDLLAGFFTGAGCWVGGVDVMKYFWNPQDDRQALAADIRAYADALVKASGRPEGSPIVLAGFSFGADLAPWVAGAGGWNGRVRGMILLGPDQTGSLQFRLLEIMGFEQKDHIFSVAEALQSAKGIPVAFIHGEKDDKSAAPMLAPGAGEPKRLMVVPGANHHFSGQEPKLKETLLQALEWIAPPDKHD